MRSNPKKPLNAKKQHFCTSVYPQEYCLICGKKIFRSKNHHTNRQRRNVKTITCSPNCSKTYGTIVVKYNLKKIPPIKRHTLAKEIYKNQKIGLKINRIVP